MSSSSSTERAAAAAVAARHPHPPACPRGAQEEAVRSRSCDLCATLCLPRWPRRLHSGSHSEAASSQMASTSTASAARDPPGPASRSPGALDRFSSVYCYARARRARK